MMMKTKFLMRSSWFLLPKDELSWRGALSLALVILTIAFSSCTKESIALLMSGGDGVEVRVTFLQSNEVTRSTADGTEVGTADEDRLDRVTILVFNEDGTILETVLSEDVTSANTSLSSSQPKWVSEQTLLVSPLINPTSPKIIYAIANWSKTAFDKATYTETMLKEELTTITAVAEINGAAAYPMLMSGSKSVSNLTSLFHTVDMERQVSKMRTLFTIPRDVQNYLPQVEWQTDLMKITVGNVPNQSYIVGRGASPAGVTLLSSDPLAVDDTKPLLADQTVPAAKDLKWSESVYITENPVEGALQANKDASTYIVMQLPYKDRVSGTMIYDNYYKLHVNDISDAASPHKVLRNTIYNFNITILGLGSPINDLVAGNNVDDQLTVNSWEKGEIVDVELPNSFFNVDRTSIVLQSSDTLLQSIIATDVADWKLVKADGVTTILSFAEGKTTATVGDFIYTLDGSAMTATVAVSKVITVRDFTTQKMFFIAKNLKVPFNVTYDNGVILNSVLTAAGWPVAELPVGGGLQVAMRGNSVQGGVAESDDPLMKWKLTNTSTPGTSEQLGMGVSSTAAMAGAEHPAAQYCRNMGSDWYLPSKKELSLLFVNRASLGTSYKFTISDYWSASEFSELSSSFVYFGTGGVVIPTNREKTITYRVRCVRKL